jgi:hypothetical protein
MSKLMQYESSAYAMDRMQQTIGRILGKNATERECCSYCGSYNCHVEYVYTQLAAPYNHTNHNIGEEEYSHYETHCNDCGN